MRPYVIATNKALRILGEKSCINCWRLIPVEKNLKKRNFRHENRTALFVDFVLLMAIALVAALLAPAQAMIGERLQLAVSGIHGVMSLLFMVVLEKYSIMISGRYERTLINLLSAIYSLVLLTFFKLLFFVPWVGLGTDCLAALAQLVVITTADLLLEAGYTNPRRWRKPRLLIIGEDDVNFSRMKRIKYGVVQKFDSWYERLTELHGKTAEETAAYLAPFDAICLLDQINHADYTRVINASVAQNKDLFIVPNIINVGMTNSQLVRFDDVLSLYMPAKSLSGVQVALKRIVDVVLGVVGLVVAAIPMLVIALVIKLTSPGPVFYRQTRLTKGKKEFEIYKFRTMIPDAEKLTGPKFAEKDDPRITPIGKILRACRLDELPQILNILKGDMSVVGPRPERPVFVEKFEKIIENYDYRFEVKAGLTSLSHVYGRYSTYIHDRTYYDLFYVTHYSIWLDLKIILLTTKTMFLKSAAEGEDDFKEKTTAKNVAQ